VAVQWTQTKRSTGAGGPAAGPAGSGGIKQASRCTKKMKIVQTGHVVVPWLISTHGLSYKTARMGAVMQMDIIYDINYDMNYDIIDHSYDIIESCMTMIS
jgi:hypothetical protein